MTLSPVFRKDMVYLFTVQLAVTTVFSAGILSGIAGFQREKVYPVRTGILSMLTAVS